MAINVECKCTVTSIMHTIICEINAKGNLRIITYTFKLLEIIDFYEN